MPDVEVTEDFEPLFNEKHPDYGRRYMVFHGGRGSGKSWQVARGLIQRATKEKKRYLCAREFQVSIADSVLKLLEDQIEMMGLNWFWDVQKTTIIGRNGSEFIFKGIRHNIRSVKSTEGLDGCWLEEAQTASDESWRTLIPTLRKKGSQFFVTMNPDQESDPSYQRCIVNPSPNSYVRQVNYSRNPWFPAELEEERLHLLATDPDAHEHIWEGKPWARTDAQVLNGKWVVDSFTPQPHWDGPYFGADWGFAKDPTALIKCWIAGRTLYVEHEVYGVGIEQDDLAPRFKEIPGADQHLIRGDNARPETISHVRKSGLNVISAKKWAGSVEDGIATLRSFDRIVIHPRCKHTAEEARLWSYKIDKLTGDVLPVLVQKHDHAWDAIRYALEPIVGKDVAGISVYGRQFKARTHLSPTGLWPIKGREVFVGWDLQTAPACVFVQVTPTGQVRILEEKVAEGLGAREFAARVIAPLLKKKYRDHKLIGVGSRQMVSKEPSDERSCAQIVDEVLKPFGMSLEPSWGDDIAGLIESVRFFLNGRTQESEPLLAVDPSCHLLLRGFEGAYHYKSLGAGEAKKLQTEPERNEESRPHTALQHALQEVLHRRQQQKRQ